MKILVTGAAGFIGSNLCDFLLKQNCHVFGCDNFKTGRREFLNSALQNKNFQFIELDLLDREKTEAYILQIRPDWIIHLASNADVRFGPDHPSRDLEQGTLVSFNVLESARKAGVKKFAFSSTGSVYGEPDIFPTPENCPFPVQTSLYAAAKLSVEATMQAYSEAFGIQSFIFRFVSILGERYTHGHVFDFAKKLLANPNEIEVLGNGKQRKAYLYVGDCVRAIWQVMNSQNNKINIFNLGPDEYVNVDQSLDEICSELKVSPKRIYAGGERGWIGDSPFIFLDCQKLKNTGWQPTLSIRESVRVTLRYLLKNKHILEAHK